MATNEFTAEQMTQYAAELLHMTPEKITVFWPEAAREIIFRWSNNLGTATRDVSLPSSAALMGDLDFKAAFLRSMRGVRESGVRG